MARREREHFWILPFPGLKSSLEKVVSDNGSFKNVKSEMSFVNGIADIRFKDKKEAEYKIIVERDLPRYSVKLEYGEDADKSLVKALKGQICDVCAGQACIDVYINGKGLGAIPLKYHNV